MNTKLYANISFAHENDWSILEKRIISAAQCNADAIVISKATPSIVIPEEKKYVSINSKWGALPYIDVAKKSEISADHAYKISELTDHIGIPVIWSVTDADAASWVKENTNCQTVKIHYDYQHDWETVLYVVENFTNIIYANNEEIITRLLTNYLTVSRERSRLTLYHAGSKMPTNIENLQLSMIDKLKKHSVKVGYEGRAEGIYPDCAIPLKDIEYVEKYLGDDDELNPLILTPEKFYDFFVNMNQIEIANGEP
jgi:sialic acid synthase SpsE